VAGAGMIPQDLTGDAAGPAEACTEESHAGVASID